MARFLLILLALLIPIAPGYGADLLETYRLALANDPDYKIATFNQQARHEIKNQSIAQMLPNLRASISSDYNHYVTSKPYYLGTGNQSYWDHVISINIKQAVFNWSHWLQLDQAELITAQAQAEQQAKYQALISRTVTAYFNVLAALDILEFNLAEQKAIEQQLARAKTRYGVGRAALPDVYEAQAAYDRTVASVIEAQNQVDNAKEALQEITGVYPCELTPLGGNIPLTPPKPDTLTAWAENAEIHNYSVIAQVKKTEFSQLNIELQQSRHFPTIDLTAEFRIEDSNIQFGTRGDMFAFGLLINIPLFEGGATESRIRQAKHQYRAAQQELIQITRSVTRSAKDNYRGILASIGKTNALETTARSAELALQSAELGFNAGRRNMVDVLIEQRNLYKAKTDYAKSRYEYLLHGIKLKETVGMLNEEDIQLLNRYLQKR